MTIQPSTVRVLRTLIDLAKQAGVTHIPIDIIEKSLDNIEREARDQAADLESLYRAGL